MTDLGKADAVYKLANEMCVSIDFNLPNGRPFLMHLIDSSLQDEEQLSIALSLLPKVSEPLQKKVRDKFYNHRLINMRLRQPNFTPEIYIQNITAFPINEHKEKFNGLLDEGLVNVQFQLVAQLIRLRPNLVDPFLLNNHLHESIIRGSYRKIEFLLTLLGNRVIPLNTDEGKALFYTISLLVCSQQYTRLLPLVKKAMHAVSLEADNLEVYSVIDNVTNGLDDARYEFAVQLFINTCPKRFQPLLLVATDNESSKQW